MCNIDDTGIAPTHVISYNTHFMYESHTWLMNVLEYVCSTLLRTLAGLKALWH